MKKNILRFLLPAILIVSIVVGCKKNNLVVDKDPIIPPAVAKFLTTAAQRFDVTSTNTSLKIPVSVTDVTTADRTVSITVTSASGAQAGTHYTIPNSVTIPAGKTIDSLPVSAIYNAYQTGRRDTLTITIIDGDVKAAAYNNKYTLYLYGPCYEGNVTLSNFLGDFDNTIEKFGTGNPYGPYTTTVSAVNPTSATTGTVSIENIWDTGWGPITFELNWTDPANRTLTVVPQSSGIGDAGDLGAAYAGMEVQVRPFAGQTGTFSACDGTITIKMQLGVAGLGWFSGLYTVTMAR